MTYSLFNIRATFPASHSSHLRFPPSLPSFLEEKKWPCFTTASQNRDPPLRRTFFSLYSPINILLSGPGKSMVRFIRAISGDSEPSILNH